MFGFNNMPSSSTRWSYSASNTRCSVSRRDLVAPLERVVAVHQHFGLDDRDDALVLAQRGVARERVRVHVEAETRRDVRADRDDRAPLREARTELAVLDETRAQPVETVGDELVGRLRERRRALVDLDAGDDALRLEDLRRAGGRRTAFWRIVSSNRITPLTWSAAPGGREQHLAVGAPAVLGRLAPDRVEALLDRAAALVGGQDALARRDERPCRLVQSAVPCASPLVSMCRVTPTRWCRAAST